MKRATTVINTLRPLLMLKITAAILVCCSAVLTLATWRSLQPLPDDLSKHIQVIEKNTYFDRNGRRLNITYENEWNVYDTVALHQVPDFLRQAFILSEDKRFMLHGGVDWLARLSAVKQNLLAGEVVRGASTISEQVVRMLHPRPRTLWSRWLEGFEAMALENLFSKPAILEFYLNQVPYSARRRGVIQAARYYFDRDLSTLNEKEMLALAVLVRSPKWLDPQRQISNLNQAIDNLSARLDQRFYGSKIIAAQPLVLAQSTLPHNVSHFIQYTETQQPRLESTVHTTLNLELQGVVQNILDNRLDKLTSSNVKNGAVLVVSHDSNEILAWVVGHAGQTEKEFNKINAVTVARQPGSTLKPLLYAGAIRKGWTAASMLDDAPLQESVGLGMHTYHNYSRDHYGLISVREALGNSLNIPAVKAIQFVGPAEFLSLLRDMGIDSLSGHPNVYGDGLALGNGEVTLYELVQAYTVLARLGDFKPLSVFEGEHRHNGGYRVLSEDIVSLVADIMSDPSAREKEFGWDSILNFPHQTAVKTGTSSDYRDAWAMGFNDRYTVGVWMGNLDYTEMNEVTGSTGPAMVLRSIFNELNKNREIRPLFFSPNLVKQSVCMATGLKETDNCDARDEWFIAGTEPNGRVDVAPDLRIRKPSKGLMLAMDPRIPDEQEYFEFALSREDEIDKVLWYVNDELIATTHQSTYHWKLARGEFTARAEVFVSGTQTSYITETIPYKVN